MGKILYDRQNMGRYLDEEALMHKFHWPLFFLDGGDRSFKHEKEVRFIFHDRDSWGDVRDEILKNGSAEKAFVEVMRDRFLKRDSIIDGQGIKIPFDLSNGTLEIIFGSKMKENQKQGFIQRLEEIGCENFDTSNI